MKTKHLLIAILAFLLCQSAIAQENGKIVLGAVVSFTGKYTTNGEHTKNGYNLAVKLINESGGVKVNGQNYEFRIVYYDDESSPVKAAQLAERLIKQDKIKYMLGPYSSELTQAIALVTEKYKIPMIEANGAARTLFTKDYRYFFAVLSSADQYLVSAIDLIANQVKNPKKIKLALAFENDLFSQDVRLGVLVAAKKYGMKIVIDDKLPKTLDDMAPTLSKVRALQPDMLLVSGHAKGASTAVRQIEQLKINVQAVAMTHCESAEIEKKVAKSAEYILCAKQWQKQLTYNDDDGLFGNGFDFVRIFQAEYGYEPPYQAAESAVALQVWRNAFERANSLNTEKLRDAIASTQMQTFYGNVKFDDTGRNIAKPMVISQILKSTYQVVFPEKWAAAKVVYPRPRWSER